MPRHKLEEEHVNHERWLVSYADFITLLFAFFVVMYSISQVNESKYRVLSNTLTETFNKPSFKLTPIQVDETHGSAPTSAVQLDALAVMERDGQGERDEAQWQRDAVEQSNANADSNADKVAAEQADAAQTEQLPQQLRQISEQVANAFGDLMRKQLVTLRGNEQWLEVALSSSMLFGSGDAALSPKAEPILSKLAVILREQPNAIRVEGFTDNMPIATSRYPSNWELSAARAVSVVQYLSGQGLQPTRLMAVGYGEFHPVADNVSESGRARNRRVVLMISASSEVRPRLPRIAPARLKNEKAQGEKPAAATQLPQVQSPPPATILPAPAPTVR